MLCPAGASVRSARVSDLPRRRDGRAVPSGELKKISFAWNAGAPCLLAVTVAKDKGFFAKHGLDVDLINYAGSTDQLLETLATGKADAAVGMALRWLKPLEQGFDVKIIASLHGGCMRLFAPADSGINQVADLKGKTIGVSDMNSPAKNFFAIVIRKAGLDPTADVEFKQFPAALLRVAIDKGEAHAIADGDPNTFLWLKDGQLKEVSSNLSGEYANRVCCIVGVRGSLVRDDKRTAASIALALLELGRIRRAKPGRGSGDLCAFAAGKVAPEDLGAGEISHPPSSSDGRRSEEGTRALRRGVEAGFGLQAQFGPRLNTPSESTLTC